MDIRWEVNSGASLQKDGQEFEQELEQEDIAIRELAELIYSTFQDKVWGAENPKKPGSPDPKTLWLQRYWCEDKPSSKFQAWLQSRLRGALNAVAETGPALVRRVGDRFDSFSGRPSVGNRHLPLNKPLMDSSSSYA